MRGIVSRLKRLIHEIHRRSLWQVLGIYLGGAWVARQGVEALISGLGLLVSEAGVIDPASGALRELAAALAGWQARQSRTTPV